MSGISLINNGFGVKDKLLFFQESYVIDMENKQKTDHKDDEDFEKARYIKCKFCKNIISTPNDIIEINSHHFHIFKNPAGVVYQIGCFLNAAGCLNIGEQSLAFTWFPGFSWCYAICSNCLNHLGWYYNSKGNSFYGLIMDNILEN